MVEVTFFKAPLSYFSVYIHGIPSLGRKCSSSFGYTILTYPPRSSSNVTWVLGVRVSLFCTTTFLGLSQNINQHFPHNFICIISIIISP